MAQELDSIKISGYKSIREATVELTSLNILIGPNGVGKSNFISIFKFLRHVIEGNLDYYVQAKGGAGRLLHYGEKVTKNIKIELGFPPNYYYLELTPKADDGLFIGLERAGYLTDQQFQYWEVVAKSTAESSLEETARTKGKVAKFVFEVLKSWRVYHFHDTSDSAGVKKYANVADYSYLFEDAANLAAFLYILKNTETAHYERIVKTIQLVIPFFKDFRLEPNPLNQDTIRLSWYEKNSDKVFTAADLSDGSLRFICLATLLLQPHLPKLILLDEPELGLHPSAITVLAGLLKKASQRSQVIVSTQSVNLLSDFTPEDVIVVERVDDQSSFKRLDSERLNEWLSDYSLGDLWEKNILGGRP